MSRERKILIATHIDREAPGSIADVIKERGFQFSVINVQKAGEAFPSPKEYGALIIMGGPQSAKDKDRKMQAELAGLQEALKEGKPVLGVCLGLQTLTKAAGGEIIDSPRKEVGFRTTYSEPLGTFYSIQLTPEGKKDPLFAGLSDTLPVFHLHGEAVELPPTMNPQATRLATAEVVPNQVVKVGSHAYGIQGHFELTAQLLEQWLAEDPDLFKLGQRGKEQVRADFQQKQQEYAQTGRIVFNNFLNLLS